MIMLSPFICGSFQNQELEDDIHLSPCTSPTSKKSRKKNNNNKNPYSTRGLDKFSALLAELEEKRQKIYSQVGSQDISFVRFVYSSSNDCVPVIVKTKVLDQHQLVVNKDKTSSSSTDQSPEKSPRQVNDQETRLIELNDNNNNNKNNKKKKAYFKLNKWRRPSYYMPLFVILILVFLALFGRSMAILCTSIGWYLVPTLSTKTTSLAKPGNSNKIKKKQLVRRFSEVGPRTKNTNGDHGKDIIKTPHARQNSF